VQRAVRARFIHWRIPRLLALSKYKRINRTNARLLIILHLEFSPSADLFAIAPAMRFNIVASRHVAWQRAKHRSTAGFCMPAERSVVPWMFSERERGAGIRYRGSNRAKWLPPYPVSSRDPDSSDTLAARIPVSFLPRGLHGSQSPLRKRKRRNGGNTSTKLAGDHKERA
jgi:hypothetical protein